ncbi:MAG: methyltransferase domain-containing protein [Phormidesmis sp.]
MNNFSQTAGGVGIGLSDWEGYAKPLSRKLSYVNTFFHQEPFLDITNPIGKDFEKYDFIIASDVFEHVPPPSLSAFEGAYKLLKPDGILILTVPFTNEDNTQKHFPDLGEYQIVNFKNREYILVNQNSDGEFNTYKDLVFHGGPGTTLEMRVFCRKDLTAKMQETGFQNIQYFDSDVAEYGILHKVNWSLPVTALKPEQ